MSAVEHSDLPNDGTTGVGAVWDRYYSMLPAKTRVVAYVSSVADESGSDDSCQAGDDRVPLTSPEMDTWSATRWISRVAVADGLLVAGENAGLAITSDNPAIRSILVSRRDADTVSTRQAGRISPSPPTRLVTTRSAPPRADGSP